MEKVKEKVSCKDIITVDTQNKQKNGRVKYVDIARGIAIISMVMGHTIQGLSHEIVYSFHMPLFIILSGMFYKERNFKETIKNIFFKLILPYVICTLVVEVLTCKYMALMGYYIIDWLRQISFSVLKWGNKFSIENVTSLSALWFMPMLAGVRLIFRYLKKASKGDSVKLIFLVALISYLGYVLGINGYLFPFSIDVSMFCVAFYYIGYILRQNERLDKILKNKKILLIISAIWIIAIVYNGFDLGGRRYTNGAFLILTSTCGTIMILKISQLIEKYLKYLGDAFAWYGKNSMFILAFHYIESKIFNYSGFYTSDNIRKSQVQVFSLKILIITTGVLILNWFKKLNNYFEMNKQNKKVKNIRAIISNFICSFCNIVV